MGYGYTANQEAAGAARADTWGEEFALMATSAVLPATSEAVAEPLRLAAALWVGALLIVLAFLVIYPLLMPVFER